ncbi:hypothetical protein A7U60_g9027 [Sanghuangporus baumii]|uniref:BTB domain-containing protein n=1 Tax=Sanghuangporus baumii TaxID=108892 RepID=A0A9Q5MY77_SANBA|nr:hypothetical protein A7U60_g9027 [Sanghuangporus baumii]
MSTPASPAHFVMNGRSRSQNNSSPYPPSGTDSAAQSEHGESNGQQGVTSAQNSEYVGAGPSSGAVNGHTTAVYGPSLNDQIIDHLYNAGFQMGQYADTLLHAHGHRYQLHALVLSRSPYLAHLIAATPKTGGMHSIYVPLDSYPEITDQGFAVGNNFQRRIVFRVLTSSLPCESALGYLYSSVSLNNLTPLNVRAVLSAGCLLGGMEELCSCAYQACRESISVDTVNEWVDFVDTGCLLGGMEELCSYAYQACRESISVDTVNEWVDFVDSLSPSDGSATPSEVQHRPNILGPYADLLRSDVFNYLVVTLPSVLDVHSTTGNGRDTLLGIFSRLGFDLFKSAIESSMFQIGTDQERFRFAKSAIELRKRTRGQGVDEAVVLAFGGGHSGSAVHVTRKTKKKALYKVG